MLPPATCALPAGAAGPPTSVTVHPASSACARACGTTASIAMQAKSENSEGVAFAGGDWPAQGAAILSGAMSCA